LEKLTFYFDRCFGKRLPEVLSRTRPPFNVEHQHSSKNRFKQTMKDDAWLAICGQNNWIAFSHDRKFHAIAVEIEAIKQHKVCFYLWGANDETFEKLRCFMGGYHAIERLVRDTQKPFIFHVAHNYRITKIEIP
jgi:PIN like domain